MTETPTMQNVTKNVTKKVAIATVAAGSLFLALLPWEHHGLLASCLGAHPQGPDGVWAGWSLAPEILLPLAAVFFGIRSTLAAGGSRWLIAGGLLLILALISPLCRVAATLVSAHMVQFMILCIAAPLLLTSLLAASRLPLGPLAVAYAAAIWIWHLPPVYAAILDHAALHLCAVALLLVISVLFWRSVLAAADERPLAALTVLLVTMGHTGFLGAWLTFGARPWFPFMADSVVLWDLTLLEDQQLAGLLIWVVGGLAYLLAALAVCERALHRSGGIGLSEART